MAEAEVAVFVAPGCPWCRKMEELLGRKGVRYTAIDATADWRSMRELLRHAGQPTVPCVVAYGEVMVGFDPERLEELLEGLQERADAFERNEAEQEQELRDSEERIHEALGPEADEPIPELDGVDPLPDERR